MTPEQLAGLLSLGSLLKDLGALGGLMLLVWLLLDGRLVTRGHLTDLIASEKAQTMKAEAREAEWKRLATRGAEEILPPLASAVREQLRARRDEA